EAGDAVTGSPREIECDAGLHSGGWNPTVHLFSQSRGKLGYDAGLAAFVPEKSVQTERSAGSCTGRFARAHCRAQGFAAGLGAAGVGAAAEAGFPAHTPGAMPSAAAAPETDPPRSLWLVPSAKPHAEVKAFVDHQNDVKASDILLAEREGYTSVEHLKRYTTM